MGKKATIVSDPTWRSSDKEAAGWVEPGFAAAGWAKPVSFGKLGVAPWGDVIAGGQASAPAGPAGQATPAAGLTVVDGFKVELLHSASKEEGSWISMAIDAKGRLIVSPQGDKQPLLRITLDPQGQVAKLEKIELPVWTAMGLLHAFDSLYVSGNGSHGIGLYRLRDTNGDDQYDQVDFLRKFEGGGG